MPNLALRPRFDSTQIAAARAFNKEKEGVVFDARRLPEPLRSLAPDSDLFAWVVFLDQYYGGLGVDGKLGENTVSLYPQARITAHVAENPAFDATALERAAGRAKSAVDLGIKYKLGKGGFKKSQPRRPRPDDAGHCDCSGFVSWVVEVQRDPTNPMGDWLETTRMVRDATSAQTIRRDSDPRSRVHRRLPRRERARRSHGRRHASRPTFGRGLLGRTERDRRTSFRVLSPTLGPRVHGLEVVDPRRRHGRPARVASS